MYNKPKNLISLDDLIKKYEEDGYIDCKNSEEYCGYDYEFESVIYYLKQLKEKDERIAFLEKEKTVNTQRVSVDFEEENLKLSGIINSKCEEICQLKQITKDISRLI